ncbi:hypothetical protein QBC46DRAFT_422661 [Diplogelasinospora grovesii]|uniref:FAD dependent oxidoreductase domain-containing protein n=1 Tax=Diplogelasinospora grovesii TaxID=303347 RepID=A0AAN6MZI6_9PEZI|nr:hypothetical protein QBC46DRAFT_422661 [Diplogelasinospora grovesii]
MGYSADSLPYVGCVPGRDGVFVLAGFNGHDMPVAYLAAKGMAEMVGEDREYEQTNLPSLYMTSHKGLMPRFDDILEGGGCDVEGTRIILSEIKWKA